jgi:hypothetical protein
MSVGWRVGQLPADALSSPVSTSAVALASASARWHGKVLAAK